MKKITAIITIIALLVVSMCVSTMVYANPSGTRAAIPDDIQQFDGEDDEFVSESSSGDLPTGDTSSELPTQPIPKPTSAKNLKVTLSATKYVYNGKVKKPTVTVKTKKGAKVPTSNYTVSYSKGRKVVGKYTVTVKFKKNYTGTVKKTFTIVPKGTSLTKVIKGKKKFTAKWKKQAVQTTGYQIQYSKNSKFKKGNKIVTVKGAKTTKKVVKKLKKGTYYVRIRTYKQIGKTKYTSSWSKSKKVKVVVK